MGEAALKLAPANRPVVTEGRDDPLIDALFQKLPRPGEAFPADERAAWLEMMSTAFTIAYGGTAGGSMKAAVAAVIAPRAPARPKAKAKSAAGNKRAKSKPGKPAKPTGPSYDFYIDKEHFARREGGDRIMPADVAGGIVDLRGEFGDLMKITWADNSTGIPQGLQLDVMIG